MKEKVFLSFDLSLISSLTLCSTQIIEMLSPSQLFNACYQYYTDNEAWRVLTNRKTAKRTRITNRFNSLTTKNKQEICEYLAEMTVCIAYLPMRRQLMAQVESIRGAPYVRRVIEHNKALVLEKIASIAVITAHIPLTQSPPAFNRYMRVTTESYTSSGFYNLHRFRKNEFQDIICSLKEALGYDGDDPIILRTYKEDKFMLEEGFILVLRYFASAPSFLSLQTEYQRDDSTLSRIYNRTLCFIDENFGCLVDDSVPSINDGIAGGLLRYAQALPRHIAAYKTRLNCTVLPPLFAPLDGTLVDIARFGDNQKPYVSGTTTHAHCVNALAIVAPTLLVMDVKFYPGSQPDSAVRNQSNLDERLIALRTAANLPHDDADAVVYGDSGFRSAAGENIIRWTPWVNEIQNLGGEILEDHKNCTAERAYCEHAFQESSNKWHIKDATNKLKVGSSPNGLETTMRVWFLLTNYMIIFRSSNSAQRYGITPPDIYRYNRGEV